MEIKIELDESHIMEQVIQEIADRLMNQYGADSLTKLVKKAVDADIQARLDETILLHMQSVISKPIQRFDTFGQPVGTPLSLEEIMRSGAERYLTEMTKSDGTISTSQFDTNRKPRLMWAVERVAIEGLAAHINTEAKAIKAELQKKATAAAAQLLTQIRV